MNLDTLNKRAHLERRDMLRGQAQETVPRPARLSSLQSATTPQSEGGVYINKSDDETDGGADDLYDQIIAQILPSTTDFVGQVVLKGLSKGDDRGLLPSQVLYLKTAGDDFTCP